MDNEELNRDITHRVAIRCVDNLAVYTYENRGLAGANAALMVCARISKLLEQQEYVNVIFASAPSQNEFLAALNWSTVVDWRRVNAFHMDEYIELPEDDPRTFASSLNAKIFGRLPFRSVNYINGNAADIGQECRRYASLLERYPADIVCLGIGENGHLAFNDPHVADFNDPWTVKMVKLDAACRQQQVNDGCFADLGQVPAYAITLTIPALMHARHVYCVVPTEKKAVAVKNTLYGEVAESCPASILRNHPSAVLFLDKSSSALL